MTDPWDATRDIVHRVQDQLAQAPADVSAPPAEPAVGRAEALDGLVRVEATLGRVSSLRVDPSALRTRLPDLVAAIVEATNSALDAARTATVESLPTPPSLDQMTRTLNELSADSLRAADRAAEGVRRSMAAIQRISELHRKRT
jgi:hypothetical protein